MLDHATAPRYARFLLPREKEPQVVEVM